MIIKHIARAEDAFMLVPDSAEDALIDWEKLTPEERAEGWKYLPRQFKAILLMAMANRRDRRSRIRQRLK